MMAYGKDMPETPRGPRILHGIRRDPRTLADADPLDERKLRERGRERRDLPFDLDSFLAVIRGIRERTDFLREMESLGLEKKYRPIMQQEIAQKIRLIESMNERIPDDLRKEIRGFGYERSSPRPFPLGDSDRY